MNKNQDWLFCEKILPKVSRTFALNISKLSGTTYKSVLLGYLIFRIADTFEDTENLNENEKVKILCRFSDIFKGNKKLSERLRLYGDLKYKRDEKSDEKNLLVNGDRVLRCYFKLPSVYRKIIDPLVSETSLGMAEYQKRKLDSGLDTFQLRNFADLEKYCYYVAGVVGKMLTRIFSLKKTISPVRRKLEKYQMDFGLALQLVNIVKDFRKDIGRGWFYVPKTLIDINKTGKFTMMQKKKTIKKFISRIIKYFDSTLKYIKFIPLGETSVRLFCIIPFVLAYNTLENISKNRGDKISREKVFEILEKSVAFAKSNALLEKDYLETRDFLRHAG